MVAENTGISLVGVIREFFTTLDPRFTRPRGAQDRSLFVSGLDE
jgi:hypothetical protein